MICLNPDKEHLFTKIGLLHRCLMLLISLTSLVGCTSVRLELPEKIRVGKVNEIKDWLPTPYAFESEQIRLVQRIILSVPHREMDMTGYLVLKHNGDWLALVLVDMGMELFRFEKRNGELRVLAAPQGLPQKPLLDGVVKDIDYLFGSKNPVSTFGSYSDELPRQQWIQYDKSHFDEYIFETESKHPNKSREFIQNRLIRSVRYEDYRFDSLKKTIVPHRIVLKNHRWHYEMEINLYQVEQLTK